VIRGFGPRGKVAGVRSQNQRAERLAGREVRLYDPVTFARLCRARDYLAAHYNYHVSLPEAAREACLSQFHFQRLFAHAFGETPHEFVTGQRIAQAKKLLLDGSRDVTDVCFEVGYESLGSFSTRFRSLTGLSPAAFRREARRVFGNYERWPLYCIPTCYQHYFVGIS
jgi:AraC-like DNA-binding protein